MDRIFENVPEKDITRAIVREFMSELDEYVESDVIIIGGGPGSMLLSGRKCARQILARVAAPVQP